jgi:aminoglycoside phosphotransferase (APT) family kinase protein
MSPAPRESTFFSLWRDDLPTSNILLNKADDIVAVIDWEFAYITRKKFALNPPWWLLLTVPKV